MTDPALANSAKFYSGRCLSTRQTAEARAVYEDLALTREKNPFRDAGQLSLAQLLSNSGRKKEALKQLSALAQATSNPEIKAQATVKSGLIMADLGEREKASAFCRKRSRCQSSGAGRKSHNSACCGCVTSRVITQERGRRIRQTRERFLE